MKLFSFSTTLAICTAITACTNSSYTVTDGEDNDIDVNQLTSVMTIESKNLDSEPAYYGEYPNLEIALNDYISTHITQKNESRFQSGTVVIRATISTEGILTDPKVVINNNDYTDSLALEAVKSLGLFSPGYRNSKTVDTKVIFRIDCKPELIPATEINTEILIIDDSDYEVEEVRSIEDFDNNANNDSRFDNILQSTTHHEVVLVDELPAPKEDPDKVFDSVEQSPEFPGGQAELIKFIANNLRYPASAAENGIQGKVVVQFVIKKDGSIGQVKVVRSKDPDLDAEAIRVVKTLPNFNPGKMNGQPVNVWYILPVTFKLAQ